MVRDLNTLSKDEIKLSSNLSTSDITKQTVIYYAIAEVVAEYLVNVRNIYLVDNELLAKDLIYLDKIVNWFTEIAIINSKYFSHILKNVLIFKLTPKTYSYSDIVGFQDFNSVLRIDKFISKDIINTINSNFKLYKDVLQDTYCVVHNSENKSKTALSVVLNYNTNLRI